MPRTARSIVGGYAYHVLNRANGRLQLCKKQSDFLAFDQILQSVQRRQPYGSETWQQKAVHKKHPQDGHPPDGENESCPFCFVRLESFLRGKPICLPGSDGAKIVPAIAPQPGEYQVMKNRFSGFMDTELDFILRRRQVESIVVCGTQYPCCVRATLVDGLCYGYQTTCLTDATSAQCQEVAEANIHDLKDMGIRCVSVAEFIQNDAEYACI